MKTKGTGLFRKAYKTINRWLHTKRGHDIVLYLMCVVIAALFWIFFALDEETERDYEVPVELRNVPDSIVVIGQMPHSINVVVRGKGTQFFRYDISSLPTIDFDYRQCTTGGNTISLSRTKIDSRIRDLFGQNVSILSVAPDSISIAYTHGDGYRLPLKVNTQITISSNSILSGQILTSTDSVTVYTANGQAPTIDHVETEPIILRDLAETTKLNVRIRQIPGMRITPAAVSVTIPVERLVSKRRTIQIETKNVPADARMIIYPTTVDINYLAPLRLSNKELPIKASVDYDNIQPGTSNIPIRLTGLQGDFKLLSTSQDSVQYIIEQ